MTSKKLTKTQKELLHDLYLMNHAIRATVKKNGSLSYHLAETGTGCGIVNHRLVRASTLNLLIKHDYVICTYNSKEEAFYVLTEDTRDELSMDFN